MNKYTSDGEFWSITEDILTHSEFNKIKNENHHGINRYNHALKVAYRSYKIAKKLKLDYKAVARAGLLHDFFFSTDIKENESPYLSHPSKSLTNASKYFKLNEVEVDIITKHMFPAVFKFPKYKESWVVSTVDTGVATVEFGKKFKTQLSVAVNLFLIFILKTF